MNHVRNDGTIGPCSATKEKCPYGGNPHSDDPKELKVQAEQFMESKYGGSDTSTVASKKPAPKWDRRKKYPPKDARRFGEYLESKNPGLTMKLSGDHDDNGYVVVSSLGVDESKRGTGLATKGLNEVIKEADRNGWKLSMTPTSDFGANKNRLVEFNKRFGFVHNKGSNKDYSTMETMLRLPENKKK